MGSSNVRNLAITNNLPHAILAELVGLEGQAELAGSGPPTQVVPPGATAGFDMHFKCHTEQVRFVETVRTPAFMEGSREGSRRHSPVLLCSSGGQLIACLRPGPKCSVGGKTSRTPRKRSCVAVIDDVWLMRSPAGVDSSLQNQDTVSFPFVCLLKVFRKVLKVSINKGAEHQFSVLVHTVPVSVELDQAEVTIEVRRQ